jgi:predicted amino acid racemase
VSYPRLVVDTKKIENNVRAMVALTKARGISTAGVTKVFCAAPELVKAYVDGGVDYLADSRLQNLKRMKDAPLPKMMLRLPMISEAEELVKYADISLNSEIATVRALNSASEKIGKVHKIILMADLGDLREGYFKEEDMFDAINEIKDMKWIEIAGIGVNLTCYGGVIATAPILKRLTDLADKIREKFGLKIEIVSGGNSSSMHLVEKGEIPEGISNLRFGEVFVNGSESGYGKQMPGTDPTAFVLEAEAIEVKEKPSVPTEEIGRDAFGQIPTFVDRGVRKRILCAIGKQDVDHGTLYPEDKGLIILGGSSDHLILDGSDSETDYKPGDIVRFNMHYVSILRLMTSEFVEKVYER